MRFVRDLGCLFVVPLLTVKRKTVSGTEIAGGNKWKFVDALQAETTSRLLRNRTSATLANKRRCFVPVGVSDTSNVSGTVFSTPGDSSVMEISADSEVSGVY